MGPLPTPGVPLDFSCLRLEGTWKVLERYLNEIKLPQASPKIPVLASVMPYSYQHFSYLVAAYLDRMNNEAITHNGRFYDLTPSGFV